MELCIDTPLEIGDTVYWVFKYGRISKDDIHKTVVKGIVFAKDEIFILDNTNDYTGSIEDIGKPLMDIRDSEIAVYLTREDAERAVAEWNERRC